MLKNNKKSNNYFVKYLLCTRHCQTQRDIFHIFTQFFKISAKYVVLLTFKKIFKKSTLKKVSGSSVWGTRKPNKPPYQKSHKNMG